MVIRAPVGIYMVDEEQQVEEGTATGVFRETLPDGRISIRIAGAELQRLHKPWSRALIVRVLGKSPEYKYLYDRLVAQWHFFRGFELTDLENGCYCVHFYCKEDYDRVLLGGPWMILGHYLTVQIWSRHFDPHAVAIPITPVWIRLRGLSIEYFDKEILMELGEGFGRPVKVDMATIAAARGKFARICVELDLSQKLLPAVVINGKEILVEYEGMDRVESIP